WLTPWFERQHAINARTAEAVEALVNRDHERALAFEQFQSALITFLQQITAFIDTKDRQLSAVATGRIDEQQKTLAALQQRLDDTLPELRAQVVVLQRAMEMLKRQAADAESERAVTTAPASASTAAPPRQSADDYKYVGFEDAFRGSDNSVAEKLEAYLPIFQGASDVVDLGCGRGEFLAALRSAGVTARGVDTNAAMVAVAREQGLDVTRNDALGYVASLPDESIGGVIATQVVEHLEPSYLFKLLDALSRTLRRGAPIVLETINPACWYAFFSSYIRDITHVRPVHPETLQYLLRASGFERVEIRYRSPLPDHVKLQMAYVPEDVRVAADTSAATLTRLVDTANANAVRMNELMFAHMDYAVVGYRI
ncbi:MAG TPA: class I SAM-dependent methyltransferase, partial [Vicinamibacterales bacterium]|nr:class I SAM-dependent methyltransferase [Vicinamibacterales bacterium]